ncbi:MAG: hypothetical protein ABL921_22965 [Pirellula sp.]
MTPSELQKIVDGEISHEDRAKLLNSLGENSHAWRMLALALIEEHEWSRRIAFADRYNKESAVWDQSTREGTAPIWVQPRVPLFAQDGNAKSASRFRPWTVALAASVLFLAGFYGSSWFGSGKSIQSPSLASDSAAYHANLGKESMLATREMDDGNGMKIVLTGPNSETSEIPIYDLKNFDPSVIWAREDIEFAKANEQLRRRGYELDVRPELYTGTLNDGRQLVVPVKHFGLKPYGL